MVESASLLSWRDRPSAHLGAPKAKLAPPGPERHPARLGSLRWPQQLASGPPYIRGLPTSHHQAPVPQGGAGQDLHAGAERRRAPPAHGGRREGVLQMLELPCISPASPRISHASPLHLPFITFASPLQVLQMLELPYRKVLLCSGDIGFSARCRASKKGNPKKRPAGLGPAHPPARCPANGPRGPQTSEGEGAKYCPRSGAHVL